jgi:hypothetical protein
MLSQGHSVYLNGLTIPMRTTHRERHDDLDGLPIGPRGQPSRSQGSRSYPALSRRKFSRPGTLTTVGQHFVCGDAAMLSSEKPRNTAMRGRCCLSIQYAALP